MSQQTDAPKAKKPAKAAQPETTTATTTASNTANDDVEGLSYERAREELVAVVSRLEAGGVSLEESLDLWERGEALAQRCEEWLQGARRRLAQAREDTAAPTDTPDGENGGDDD